MRVPRVSTEAGTVEALAHELGELLGPRCRWLFIATPAGSPEVVLSSMRPDELRRFVEDFARRRR